MRIVLETRRPVRGARLCARFGLLLLLAHASALPAHASALAARAHSVSVTVEDHEGVYSVRGAFEAPVPAGVAWSVLTDYDHIGAFVTSMRSSSIERRDGSRLLVRQEAQGGMFALRRRVHVLLKVREEPERRISFTDVLGCDFRRYDGGWSVEPVGSGTSVRYELEARPVAAMPHVLGRAMLRRAAERLLEQVRGEMLRRAAAPRAR